MEYLNKKRKISLLFAAFFLTAIYGFFRTYFGLFPTFSPQITLITHLHGISVTLWLLMCIAQPLLIRYKKRQWHIRLGQFSYFFVPILALVMVMAIHQGYVRGKGHIPQEALLAFQFVPLSTFAMFVVTYILAMLHRHNRLAHRSYLIVNVIVLLSAAFGRLNYGWLGITGLVPSVTAAYMVSNLLLLCMMIIEWRQGRANRVHIGSFVVLILITAFYYYGTTGVLWQSIARFIFGA